MLEGSGAEPRLPPPGRRNGEGSASILPYLLMSLATRPAPPVPERAPGPGPPDRGPPKRQEPRH